MKQTWVAMGTLATLLAGLLSACGATPFSHAASSPANPSHWLQSEAAKKSVTLKVFAGEDNGMNFNGYDRGGMIITVPADWKVTVDFVNTDNAQAHSAMIVPFADRVSMNIPTTAVAFPDASTPDPTDGTGYGIAQSFRFTAGTSSGTYALVCGVPGHAAMGMWDKFVVSKTAQAASITVHGAH